MNYGTIKYCDIANGPGCRVSLFVSGCTNHCRECFQPETWDFAYGKPFDEKAQEEMMEMASHAYIHGLTILGGEPFEPDNQRALLPFLSRFKEAYPEKTLWMYSGNRLEELLGISGPSVMDGVMRKARPGYLHTEVTDALLSLVDVLVDGRFVNELKDISLDYRGSSNQRLIDMKKTFPHGVNSEEVSGPQGPGKDADGLLKVTLWENTTSKRPM